MGIRIHKVIGWGLTDVKCTKSEINDPRFNKLSAIAGDWEEREKFNKEGYIAWLEEKKKATDEFDVKMELGWLKKEEGDNFQYCFLHGTEFMMPRVFCCIPILYYNQWQRSDDTIDYYEKKNCLNNVKVLKTPIYPFTGMWDKRDGRSIDSQFAFEFNRRLTRNKDKKEFKDRPEYLDSIAKLCGFDNGQDAKKYIGPIVPNCIRYMIEYSNVFEDNKTIFEMKPLIYTYWS